MSIAERNLRAAILVGDLDRYAHWAKVVDAEQEADEARLRGPDALRQAALWYAQHGIAVFPLQPGSKVPRAGSSGFKDATTDLEQVRRWWAARPDANIGLPTGITFDVVDIDAPAGWRSWAQIDNPLGGAPVLGKALTPSSGAHFYVPVTGRGNTAAIYPGIDYRGAGGYVVAPPSIVNDRRYTWAQPLATGPAAA